MSNKPTSQPPQTKPAPQQPPTTQQSQIVRPPTREPIHVFDSVPPGMKKGRP